ncbi:MAG: transporter substrate-binding domain-containing protein, partial [Leptolinea sp.]
PYTFINQQGKPDGFSVDLMNEVAKVMGVEVEIKVDTWQHAVIALQNGEIDFLPMMAYSAERDKLFDFSAPHTIAYDAIFTRKGTPVIHAIDDLRGKTIIVMEGDQAHNYLLTLDFITPEQLVLVDSLPNALRLLASGKGDAALMPKLVGLLYIQNLKLTNLELSPIVVEAYTRPFSFAVRNGNQTILERLSQGLNIIKSTGQYKTTYDKWFSSVEPVGIPLKTVMTYLGWVALVGLLIGSMLLAWSFSLRKQVSQRTKHLEAEINDRMQAEEALQNSEERYRLLFEEMAEGFALHEIITDDAGKPIDYRFLDVNPAYEKLTDLKRENLIGRRVLEVMPGTESYWIDSYGKVALSGEHLKIENYAQALNKWYEVSAYSPKPRQFAVSFSDITRRKQAEEQLENLAKFPAQNPNPILRISREGQVLFANPASSLLLTTLNTPVDDWLPAEWKTRIAEIFAAKSNLEMEIICGQTIYSCNFVPILDEDYVNVYGRDNTERIRAEQEIIQLNAALEQRVQERTVQLEASNKELETFAYSVSHDLRAPLRGIDGWSQALQEDYASQFDAQALQYLDRVRSEARRMGQLIDDLLNLSRISRAEMRKSAVNLSELIQSIADRIREEHKDQTIEFDIQPDLTCTGDKRLLEIAFTNLLENAVKFSNTRPIAQIAFGHTIIDGQAAFFVKDNGVGFNMAYSQNLFGAFQRMHSQTEFPGTGIGLATVRRIIQRHGGIIWADAKPNEGATFYFVFPEDEIEK